jgi:hypothetical protein
MCSGITDCISKGDNWKWKGDLGLAEVPLDTNTGITTFLVNVPINCVSFGEVDVGHPTIINLNDRHCTTTYLYPVCVKDLTTSNMGENVGMCTSKLHLCVFHLQDKDKPSTEGIVAWRVISKQILLRL